MVQFYQFHNLTKVIAEDDPRFIYYLDEEFDWDGYLMNNYGLDTSTIEVLKPFSDRHKTAFLMRYYYQDSYHDIAQILGCPKSTVQTLVKETRDALRKAGVKEGNCDEK